MIDAVRLVLTAEDPGGGRLRPEDRPVGTARACCRDVGDGAAAGLPGCSAPVGRLRDESGTNRGRLRGLVLPVGGVGEVGVPASVVVGVGVVEYPGADLEQ